MDAYRRVKPLTEPGGTGNEAALFPSFAWCPKPAPSCRIHEIRGKKWSVKPSQAFENPAAAEI